MPCAWGRGARASTRTSPRSSVTRSPVLTSMHSIRMPPSHLASSLSPTQYFLAKLPMQRLLGLCLHSTHEPELHPWFLRARNGWSLQPALSPSPGGGQVQACT